MKYYFFSYRTISPSAECFESSVCDEHPFEAIRKLEKQSEECNFTLLFFTEISEQEYKLFLSE